MPKKEEKIKLVSPYGIDFNPDNPSRNFGYIVGILKNWGKQGHMD